MKDVPGFERAGAYLLIRKDPGHNNSRYPQDRRNAMGQLLAIRNPSDSESLRKAIEERDRFLERNPNLKPYQREIERRMKNAGSSENRMAILSMMMQEKLMELKEQCGALVAQANRIGGALNESSERKIRLVKR
jgi:hypothetical protein